MILSLQKRNSDLSNGSRELAVFLFVIITWFCLHQRTDAQTQSYNGGGTAAALAGYATEDATFDFTFEVPPFSNTAAYVLFEAGGTVHGTTIFLRNNEIVFYSQSPNNAKVNRGAVAVTLPPNAVGQTIQVRATIDREDVNNTSQTLAMSVLINNGGTKLTSGDVDLGIGQGIETATHSSSQWSGGNGVTHGQISTAYAGDNLFPAPYDTGANLPTAGSLTVDFYNNLLLPPLALEDIYLSNVNAVYQLPADEFTVFDTDLTGFGSLEDAAADYDGLFITIERTSGANTEDLYRIFSDDGTVADHPLNGRVEYAGQEVGVYTVTNGVFRLDIDNSQGGVIDTAKLAEILQAIRIQPAGVFSEEYTITISNGGNEEIYLSEICSVRVDLIAKIQRAADQNDAAAVTISDLALASAFDDVRMEYLEFYQDEIEQLTGGDLDTCHKISELIDQVNIKQSALDRINAAHLAGDASSITIQDLVDASGVASTEVQTALLADYQEEIETLAQGVGVYDYTLDCLEVIQLIAEVNKSDDNDLLLLVETGTNNNIGSVTASGQDSGFANKKVTIDLNFRMLDSFNASQNYILLEYGANFRGLTIGIRNQTLVLLNLNDDDQMALHEIPLMAVDLGKQLSIRMLLDQGGSILTTRVYLIGGDGRLVTSGPTTLQTTAWAGTGTGALGRNSDGAYSGEQTFNGSVPLPGAGNVSYPINGDDRNLIYQLSPLVLLEPLTSQPHINDLFAQKAQQVNTWAFFDEDFNASDYSYQRHGDFDEANFTIRRQGGGTTAEDYRFVFSDPSFTFDATSVYYNGQVMATYTGGNTELSITFDSAAFPAESSSSKLIDGRKITESYVNKVLQAIQFRANSASTYLIESVWTSATNRTTSTVSTIFVDSDQYSMDLKHHTDPVAGVGTDASQDYVGLAGKMIEIPFLIENSNKVSAGGGDLYIVSVDNLPQGWRFIIIDDENEDGFFQNNERPFDGGKVPIEAFSKGYFICRVFVPEGALGDPNSDGANDFSDYVFSIKATSEADSSITDSIGFRVKLGLQQGTELYPDLELTATPLGVVEYIHTLSNYNEQPVQYALKVSHQVEEWKSVITDENRVAFPTTTIAGETLPLVSLGARGSGTDQQLIRLRLFVPGQRPAGFTQVTSLSAIPVSANTSGTELTVVDITEVVSGSVTLYKTLSSYSAQPGSSVNVTTKWKNLGSKAVTDVVFYEALPRNATYIKGSMSFVFPASYAGGSVIENSSNGGIAWSVESGSGADTSVTNTRIKLSSPIEAGASGSYTYQIQIR